VGPQQLSRQDTSLTIPATAAPADRGDVRSPTTRSARGSGEAVAPSHEREVVLVTFEAAQVLDVTGPLEVFSSASRFVPAARYVTRVVTTGGGPVRASCGLELASTPLGDVAGPVDTLLVAGGADMDAAVADTELLAHVRRLATGARRVTSVCSGAFVLAAAGLLAGRRATTHWAECGLLGDTYADVTVDPDAIYVRDGDVWTSAGVTAGIDLALALVADDHGRAAAATVARQLVVYLQRSGGQAQFSAVLAGQAADTAPVRDLLAWIRDHLTDDLSVPALARRVNLSERQFTRRFKAEVGATAAEHVEAVRLEAACRLLETTSRTVEQIARACGFGAPETMDRAFQRRLSTTPTSHRHHFQGRPEGRRAQS
jgi:transcriptional regulator GlxA family with amidase domain